MVNRFTLQETLKEVFQARKNMLPNRNLDLHKEIKNTVNEIHEGKIFSFFIIALKEFSFVCREKLVGTHDAFIEYIITKCMATVVHRSGGEGLVIIHCCKVFVLHGKWCDI